MNAHLSTGVSFRLRRDAPGVTLGVALRFALKNISNSNFRCLHDVLGGLPMSTKQISGVKSKEKTHGMKSGDVAILLFGDW